MTATATHTTNGKAADAEVIDALVGIARDYAGRGFIPLPLRDGKNPDFPRWQRSEGFSDKLFRTRLLNAAEPGVGVLMGPKSGIIDFEWDSESQRQKILNLLPDGIPPIGPQFTSTHGEHWLFAYDDRLDAIAKAVLDIPCDDGTKLKLRIGAGGKGAQSAFPPSRGKAWKPGLSPDDCKPPPLPESTIALLLEYAKPKHGKPQTGPARSGQAPRSDATVERARKYLAKIPPAISGQGGHDQTFHAACVLVLGFALDRGPALALLREWNDTCQPPWADHELEHKIDDALEQPGERGYLLNTDNDCPPGEQTFEAKGRRGRPRHATDVGNGERLAEQHGANVRYCHPWRRWLVWDNRRWCIDSMGEIMRRAKLVTRSIYVEASKAADKDSREALAKWAAASERRERLAAMVALAESEQPIPIGVETLDANPWVLNCLNGTLDLRSGKLREHRREDYLTKCCPVEYPTEEGIDPVLWQKFLDKIFNGNAALIGFVRRLMGASLVGEVRDHALPIFHGTGANGKSVLIETWTGILGPDYAIKAPANFLLVKRGETHPTELADLHGKRLVAAVETPDGGRLSESLVKELTGGDSIRARRMREDFWQFRPSHTVLLATNHKPQILGTDFAIWRRIRLVPFTITIPEPEQDKALAIKLRAEWPAILRWAVGGCIEWKANGLDAPAEVLAATDNYRADMDPLGDFIEECCVIGPQCEAKAGDLYRTYKTWAEARGDELENQKRFGNRLTERGYERSKRNGRVWYRGICIQVDDR
jgi:P4 family phage/plasmid primase-like protien